MSKIASIIVSVSLLLFIGCGNKYQLKFDSPKTIKINKALKISVNEKGGNPIDSVRYFINGKMIDNHESFDISGFKLGKQALSAEVYFEGKKRQLNNTIYFLNDSPPEVYTFEVIQDFPHDDQAFTQGFVYHDGYFYESTGQNGRSSLRKVEIETGKVLKKIDLDRQYFGEGMTIKDGKIYQLTWRKKIGFIYDLETFELEKTFEYGKSKEGWGLAHNDKMLIKTDGSERMWFLDPESLKEVSYIETYTDKRKAEKLNELEFVNGKIYANIWQQNSILIVNPENGAIEGIVSLKGLQAKAGQKGEDNVLNGIAYDEQNDRLFVTGKNWNKVFEIKIKEK
ncbi:glutaminyl-peptide cyclotransferase [Lutimonas zeaxanthinifaciens]|uniref:glutaminyl-peptide cyclotransferase n=1 Tax=Lutimonas zeaxanthinifaciens TaxID=3060215 RepID=UPI00265CB9ED|nr:glutaminyl-peptide cyclotransferase [Lutimonas sp. YSD2104]WKK65144.1 glutaminyl-peptide cyclotransferase [Lutimonas sp. YSD2104]